MIIRSILNKVIFRINKLKSTGKRTYRVSYSQNGEDLIIENIFLLKGLKKPSYLDIGANDPFYLSNTAIFYLKGCRGINIEANPSLIKNFRVKRREDVNLNIGINDKKDNLNFYIMTDNTLSTFSEQEMNAMVKAGHKVADIKKIELFTVQEVLDQYSGGVFPDLLTIDVEGLDFHILRSIDFKNSYPKIICVEAFEYSPYGTGARRKEMISFLVSKGYYEYANTGLNAIMVKSEFWETKP